MKRIVSVLMVLVLLFAFVACNSEAGGQSGGGSGEMSPAEQAILNKYGEDIFYFAELADMAASVGEPMEEICGAANDSARASVVSMYSAFGIQISNTSDTTASFTWTEDGVTVTIDASNVSIVPSKGLNDSMSYDAAVTVSGKENHSATVSLELDLVNNTTTITKGKYKTITFGTGSNDLKKANDCLKEIEALDDEGNGNGNNGGYNGGQNQNPYDPGQTIPGDDWVDGTASLPAITAHEIITAYEGLDFKVFIHENNSEIPFYEYGRIGNNQVWAKRWCEADPTYDIEEFYTMIALDRNPGVQISYTNPDTGNTVTSDYVTYEESAFSSNWTEADGSFYNPDGSSNWHEAVVYWLYDDVDIFSEEYAEYPYADYAGGDYYHYSDLLKPYTPTYLQYYNGKYKIQAQKATIDFITCTVYRYRNELFYIADEYNHVCMKHSRLDLQGNEQTIFEVVNLSFTPSWPVK